jgi:aquaporin related protein
MIGAIVAAAILKGLTPGELAVGCTIGNGTSRTKALFIETFGTAALVLSVLMLAAGKLALPYTVEEPFAIR